MTGKVYVGVDDTRAGDKVIVALVACMSELQVPEAKQLPKEFRMTQVERDVHRFLKKVCFKRGVLVYDKDEFNPRRVARDIANFVASLPRSANVKLEVCNMGFDRVDFMSDLLYELYRRGRASTTEVEVSLPGQLLPMQKVAAYLARAALHRLLSGAWKKKREKKEPEGAGWRRVW